MAYLHCYSSHIHTKFEAGLNVLATLQFEHGLAHIVGDMHHSEAT